MSGPEASGLSRGRSLLARWSPALLGLAFAAGGIGGVVVATSHEEAVPQGPDPLILLSDDVASLQSDLSLLGEGLNRNLEQLGEGLDAQAARRTETTRDELRGVSQKLDRVANRLRAVEERQRSIQSQLAKLREAPGTSGDSAPPPVAALPPEPEPDSSALAEDSTAPPKAEGPASKPPGRGLFSFKLSSGLDWNERLRFKVISSLSRVGFDAKSTLHDFTGATTRVEGWMVARLAHAEDGAEADIRAKAATLKTGVDGRDEEMRKVLAVEEHPWIRFQLARFETKTVDVGSRRLSGVAVGTLTISGVGKEVRVPARLSVDHSRRLVLEGELQMRLTDHGIEVPSVAGGVIGMEDEIKVWLSLRLRSLGPAKKAE